MRTRRRHDLRPTLDQLDDRCLLSGLTPAQVTQAYGLNAIAFPTSAGTVVGNGAGETIALVEAYHDATLSSDLATFDERYNLPAPSLTVIDQAGQVANAGWASRSRWTSSGRTRSPPARISWWWRPSRRAGKAS